MAGTGHIGDTGSVSDGHLGSWEDQYWSYWGNWEQHLQFILGSCSTGPSMGLGGRGRGAPVPPSNRQSIPPTPRSRPQLVGSPSHTLVPHCHVCREGPTHSRRVWVCAHGVMSWACPYAHACALSWRARAGGDVRHVAVLDTAHLFTRMFTCTWLQELTLMCV